MFQFTRPRGARPPGQSPQSPQLCFNSRARTERDCHQLCLSFFSEWFQFTRPRGARPAGEYYEYRYAKFQFTHPRGVRPKPGAYFPNDPGFNSHTRTERDTPDDKLVITNYVSTHAPARDATSPGVGRNQRWALFQLTRPRGARQERRICRRRPDCFNSRARAGRDSEGGYSISWNIVSIHAPARGATALSGPNSNQWITYVFPRSY